MIETTIPPPSQPPCKGCGQPCHPYYVRRYGGYCLDCANSGVDVAHDRIREAESQLTAIRDLLTPLLGKEACPECGGENLHFFGCCDVCGQTGQRNVADGLSVVECVQRLAKEARDYRDAASAEAFHGDEARAERDELREQVAKLRAAVDNNIVCNCRGGAYTCNRCRVLAATTPKEPAK